MTAKATTSNTAYTWHVITSDMVELDLTSDVDDEYRIKTYFRINGWVQEVWFTPAKPGQRAELTAVPVDYPRPPFEAGWPHMPVREGDKITVHHGDGRSSKFTARMKWGAMEFSELAH
jgi:hypothetical protein